MDREPKQSSITPRRTRDPRRFAAFASALIAFGSACGSSFQTIWGTAGTESGRDADWTDSGGYVAAGTFVPGAPSFVASFLLALDASGEVLWSRRYEHVQIRAVDASPSGLVLAVDVEAPPGSTHLEGAVLHTDDDGNIQWVWFETDAGLDRVYDARSTPDGGVIAAGRSANPGGTGRLFKLSSTGALEWRFELDAGPEGSDSGLFSVREVPGGGYVAGGNAVEEAAQPSVPFVVKVSATGENVWSTALSRDGPWVQNCESLAVLPDGRIVALAQDDPPGDDDSTKRPRIWVLDANGHELRGSTYDGPGSTTIALGGMDAQSDGIVAIASTGCDAPTVEECPDVRAQLLLTDPGAAVPTFLSKSFGESPSGDSFASVRATPDGGFLLTGGTDSFDAIDDDAYVVKTDVFGSAQPP